MRRSGRGLATAMAVGLMCALGAATLAFGTIAGVIVANRQAQSGADLAALAGAVAIQHQGIACDEVASSAARNGVQVIECDVDGETVIVTVSRKAPPMLGHQFTIEAQARAGPQ